MSLVDLNYNFECDWLIELSHNKLSNNKVSDNKLSDNNLPGELVENKTFLKPITIEEIVILMTNRNMRPNNIQKTLPQSYKTQIKILPFPGLA